MTATRPRPGDVVITGALLALFVGGWLATAGWPHRAALFPRIVTALGAGMCVLKGVQMAVSAMRANRTTEPVADVADDRQLIDEDEEEEMALEYIFATAGARRWVEALGWIVAFFAGLWVVGLFWTLPVFTVAYLRVAGRTSWLSAAIYAVVATGVLYLAFQQLLTLPYPRGMF